VNASYRITDTDSAHVGITALALIAYLAAGEVPGRGTYGANIDAAIQYLVSSTQENGYIQSNGTRMYSHAFATLALAEVYGMTTHRGVRDALQRSVNLIADSQNNEGGWRYKPFAPESDMSITVCQVMALRAARNSGIYVSRNVIDDAVKYVKESARAPGEQAYWGNYRNRHFGLYNNGVFKYQNKPEARASFALTAAGVATLYSAGVYEDPVIERGLDFMLDHFEEYNRNFAQHYFFYYGNYYAVQAFYTAGGERWNKYYRWLSDFLLRNQRQDGSWECDVGPGSAFATSVSTLILAIPYQYLPIFQR
jgi:squalene cyclase